MGKKSAVAALLEKNAPASKAHPEVLGLGSGGIPFQRISGVQCEVLQLREATVVSDPLEGDNLRPKVPFDHLAFETLPAEGFQTQGMGKCSGEGQNNSRESCWQLIHLNVIGRASSLSYLPIHSMGLPYMPTLTPRTTPTEWHIYGSPMGRVWVILNGLRLVAALFLSCLPKCSSVALLTDSDGFCFTRFLETILGQLLGRNGTSGPVALLRH